MADINTQNLEQFIREHPVPKQFKKHLRTIGVQSQYKLWEIDAAQICSLSAKINNSLSSKPNANGGNDQSSSSQWKKSELKIYVWMLVFYCYVFGKSIESLVLQDYRFLHSIFSSKAPNLLHYQALRISSLDFSQLIKLEWREEEDDMLRRMVEQFKEKRKELIWRDISLSLFNFSEGKLFRQPAECRQRWTNHLNPELSKANWTLEEDQLLISLVGERGNKWSFIAKCFKGKRNEHMVKNRYKALAVKINRKVEGVKEKDVNKLLQRMVGRCKEENVLFLGEQSMDEQWSSILSESKEEQISEEKEESGSQEGISLQYGSRLNPLLSTEVSIEETIDEKRPQGKRNESQKQFADLLDFDYDQNNIIELEGQTLRPVIEDVVSHLGCGHAELLDMFFDTSMFQREEQFQYDEF